jgi:hypothetical protein
MRGKGGAVNGRGRRRRRRLPSPALVVSLLALFIALGGTATALKGKWSVKRDDIAPRAVDAGKIKLGSVNGKHIADRAVGPWKLNLGSTVATAGEASTTSTVPVDLGGPTATVKVPEGAMVAIQAEAAMRVTGANNSARTYLYEPAMVPNPVQIHRSESNQFQIRISTPGIGAGDGVTSRVRSGWIVMPAAPGVRTFQLRYSTTGGTAIFKDRALRVAVIR